MPEAGHGVPCTPTSIVQVDPTASSNSQPKYAHLDRTARETERLHAENIAEIGSVNKQFSLSKQQEFDKTTVLQGCKQRNKIQFNLASKNTSVQFRKHQAKRKTQAILNTRTFS